MTVSSTAAAFVADLKTKLEAREGLSGVPVYIVAPGDQTLTESIVLIRGQVTGTQEPAELGRRRRFDAYTIPGLIRTYKTSALGGQATADVFQAAMDRAAEIVGEVSDQLRDDFPDVGEQTIAASVSDIAYMPLTSDKGGWVVDCEFSISYRARVA